MLDPALLRGHLADTARQLAARGYTLDIAAFEAIEAERKRVQTETQEPSTVATISSLAEVISCSPGATVMIVASKRGSK